MRNSKFVVLCKSSWIPTWAHRSLFIAPFLCLCFVSAAIAATINVPADQPTIQAAVNAANPGDTISVAAGNYAEGVTVNKTLTILGAQSGVDARTGRSGPATESVVGGNAGTTPFYISANGVTINGFTIQGATNPNVFGFGVLIGAGTSGTQFLNNIVQNNIAGLSLANNSAVDQTVISQNLFQNNNQPGPVSGTGIYTDQFNSGGTLTNISISNNTFASNGNPAVLLGSTAAGTQSNITVSGNVMTSNGNGIYLTYLTGSVISNNVISGSAGSQIYVGGGVSSTQITGNTASGGSARGLRIEDSFGGAPNSTLTVTGNAFAGNADAGVGLFAGGYSGTLTLAFNRIVGNLPGLNDDDTVPVIAENNWWGCNYGPGMGGVGCAGTPNRVAGTGTANVDADPWLVLGTAAGPNSINLGGTSAVSSRLTKNSDNLTPAGGFVPNTTPASFTGTDGTVTPANTTTTSGFTGTTFTATAYGAGGVATAIDSQTVSAPINVVPVCATVSEPNLQSFTGVGITIPVNTSDLTTRGVLSSDFTFTYNPAVLDPTPANITVTPGTTSPGGVVTINKGTAGTVVVSVFNSSGFTGTGTVVDLHFNVIGLPTSSSPLTLSSFKYNEGSPCVTVTNGTLTVVSGTISGTVSYGNAIGSPAPPRHVPGTLISASGSIGATTTTGLNGTYSLSALGAGPYTVTPSRSGGDNGALSGLDSAQIAEFVVNLRSFSATQQTVADVSGAGGITSFDAALIARFVVGLSGSGLSGTWIFQPSSRSYSTVYVDYASQDYDALLMGDVTGNWVDPTATRPIVLRREAQPITITAPALTASPGTTIQIPVTTGDTTDKGILSYQFDLVYDPAVVSPRSNAADVSGTVSDGRVVVFNPSEAGRLRVVVFGPLPLSGQGDLLNLNFDVIGAADSSTSLHWENFEINEGDVNFAVSDGQVTVAKASSNAVISGRVATPIGVGVKAVRATATDMNGVAHATLTSSLGFFQIADLQVGQTYTVTAASKRFRFAAQTVSLGNDAVSLDLIAQE